MTGLSHSRVSVLRGKTVKYISHETVLESKDNLRAKHYVLSVEDSTTSDWVKWGRINDNLI